MATIYVDSDFPGHAELWSLLRVPFVAPSVRTQWALFTQAVVTDDVDAPGGILVDEALVKQLAQEHQERALAHKAEGLGDRLRQQESDGKTVVDGALLSALSKEPSVKRPEPSALPLDAVTPDMSDLNEEGPVMM